MKQFTFSAQVANNLLTVLQGYSKTIRLLLVMFLTLTASTAWGQTTTTYTFSSKSWAASPANWISDTDGNQMQSGRGIQVTTGTSGANATSPRPFTNVSKIVVTYSTNASAGAGTIKIEIGSNTEVSQNVTKTGGTTDRTLTYNFSPNQTGDVKVTVTCSTNSIYLKSIAITEAAATVNHTVTWNVNGEVYETTEVTEGSKPTFPTTPESCDDESDTFYGWATATWDGKINDVSAKTIYTSANDMPAVNGAVTYYAVFAEATTTGGGGGSTDVTIDLTSNAQVATNSAENLVFTEGDVTFTNTKLSGQTNANNYCPPTHTSTRTYNGHKVTIAAGSTISKIVITAATTGYATAIQNAPWTNGSATASSSTVTWTPSSGVSTVSFTPSAAAGMTQVVVTTGGGGSTTYDNYITTCAAGDPCEKLGAATGLTVETDFVQDGQTYVKFSWTPADNTKANATNQKICFGKVDEAGTCVDDLEKNLTWTGDLKSKLEPGEYWWSIQALGDGVNYCDGDVVNGTNFTIEAPKASITLSELGVTTTDNTTYYVGAQYTLPTTSSQSCDGKQLVGWSTVEVAETDTKPTSNYYELGAEVTLAATQTFYAVFAAGSGGGGEGWTLVKDVNDLAVGDEIVIAASGSDYALSTTQNSNNRGQAAVTKTGETITFSNDVQVLTLQTGNVSNLFAFYTGSGYLYAASSSKNYLRTETNLSDNSSWSIAITNAGVATITAQGTNTNNLLKYNSSSSIFSCYSSGQLDVSIYKKAGGGGYTAYSTSCIPTYSITYDFAGGTGSHCSNTSVPQDNPTYIICGEEPTKEGYTFQGWSDGTSIYAAGATITLTKNTTLTAQWQINTYTVIWSNNGATTPVEYNHGDALVVPTAASCDGVKEFVGWTTHSGYYHATTAPDDIFTTKTTPVTATATYYAVFATPPGTGGGGGGSETNTTLDFTAQGYADATAISNLTVDGVTATFAKGSNGSNAPKYYTSGTAIRAYGGNTITLSANQITAATFTFGSSDGSNGITADCGSWDSPTWTGDATDEVVFTIGGTSGNRRITSIAVTYTSGGGSGSYSDYTTTCQQVESIEVQSPQTEFYLTDDFTIGTGKVIATLSGGGTTDVTALAHFSGYNMEATGTQIVTVTYMGATATYEITVKPRDDAWVLTWNVSGKTNTGLGPRYVTKGEAIGTLPTPEVPAACAGKTFMGWTTSNIVPSDGVGIVYITEETVPTDNTTYYAVFATVNNFCTQKPIDQITPGSKVVIVAVASLTDDGGAGKAISSRATDDTYNLQGDDVAIYDQTINTPHSTCIWTITKSGEKYIFTQDGKYLNGIIDGSYSNLKYNSTSDSWSLSNAASGMAMTYNMKSTNASTEYVEWYNGKFTIHNEVNTNGAFDMQFFVTANADGNADITDYTTGCAEYTITYYGFHGGYSTSCSSDGTIVLPVNSLHTVPDCGDVVTDHTDLGREFLNVWMTQPHGGHTFKPGDTFILTQDTTLYAQWKMETTSDVTTLPTDIEDLAGTDIYVYGGTTLNIQPGTTTINSLTLKGGLQADGSYKMPTVWVPEGATLVRNSNKINLDLIVNAKTWYPFAVPFATKNNQYVEYLDPVLAAASTYGTHFAIKTYDGARRADVGEDKANNWVRVLRDETLQPGVGYIITALTYPDKDTATIRIPMTVPNTWFKNGEQAAVNTTVRNTIAVTAHAGAAATEHQRHAGWNFVANPYLTSFAGGNVANDGGLAYINGELIIEGSYVYGGDPVPYVTVPAYDFAYYSQHKLSDVKLSPEWSFFVQVGTGGTMNFTTAGRQQAPASIAARNAEERPVKMDVDLILSDNHSSDQTGIIICDRYTDAYEIGRDLEKLFGSAYNLSVYTLMEDNTPLAFQALAIRSSMQVIPVGYRAPEQGEYTFRLNEATSSIDLLNEQYEQLVLVDYQTGELTNLLYTDYTFYSERTQSNSRFAIYAVPRQNAPTDLPNAIGSEEEVRKVIYNDHLYILRDGNVYNGMGQKM